MPPHYADRAPNPKPGKMLATYYTYKQGMDPPHFEPFYAKLTHLNYAFCRLDASGCLVLDDPTRDEHIFAQWMEIKQRHPHLKLGLSVGGWGFRDTFAPALNTPQKLNKAITSIVQTLDKHCFDYIDLDWEFPTSQEEARMLECLLLGLHATFQAYKPAPSYPPGFRLDPAWATPRYAISMAVPFHIELKTPRHWPSIATLDRTLAFLFLMAYDMEGPWSRHAAHHAHLDRSNLYPSGASAKDAVDGLMRGGFPAAKIILGIPNYARKFHGSLGLGHPFDRSHSEQDPTLDNLFILGGQDGAQTHFKIEASNAGQPSSHGKIYWDDAAKASYVIDEHHPEGPKFISIESTAALSHKIDFARKVGLGGVFFWELTCERPFDAPECLIKFASEQMSQPRRPGRASKFRATLRAFFGRADQ